LGLLEQALVYSYTHGVSNVTLQAKTRPEASKRLPASTWLGGHGVKHIGHRSGSLHIGYCSV